MRWWTQGLRTRCTTRRQQRSFTHQTRMLPISICLEKVNAAARCEKRSREKGRRVCGDSLRPERSDPVTHLGVARMGGGMTGRPIISFRLIRTMPARLLSTGKCFGALPLLLVTLPASSNRACRPTAARCRSGRRGCLKSSTTASASSADAKATACGCTRVTATIGPTGYR